MPAEADDRPQMSERQVLLGVSEQMSRRDFRAAVELVGYGVTLFPHNGRLWELGGLAAWAADDDAGVVIAALEEAAVLVPLHPFARVALADAYETAGRCRAAKLEWDFLNSHSGGNRLLAALRPHPAADWQLAFCVFRTLSDHDPGNPRGWYGLGECLARLGASPERILEPLRLAADIEPGHPAYALAAAAAWGAVGRPDLGAVELRAVRLAVVDCACWLRRAESLFEAGGDRVRAEACRRRVLELSDEE